MLEISNRLAALYSQVPVKVDSEGQAQLNNPLERSFNEIAPLETKQHGGLNLTIDQIPHPAYMVNYNFEIIWCNEESKQHILGGMQEFPKTIQDRCVLQFLLESNYFKQTQNFVDVLRFHIALAKSRLLKSWFDSLLDHLPVEKRRLIEDLYHDVEVIPPQTILETSINLSPKTGAELSFHLYASFYREGILFIYVPGGPASDNLLELLARRDDVIRKLLRKRLPAITQLAVMVTDLQDSAKICSELPPHEYFELINQIWATMGPIFRKYYGVHGKHVGDGMVYYFFPQPDGSYMFNALLCAQEVKFAMRQISKQWQMRKGWLTELYLNTGLSEGQEWLGTFQAPANVEFTVLGGTVNQASHLSEIARCGEIWATKNFISQLTPDERRRVRFGIHRKNEEGRAMFVASTYTQAGGLTHISLDQSEKMKEISSLPITEILEVNNLLH